MSITFTGNDVFRHGENLNKKYPKYEWQESGTNHTAFIHKQSRKIELIEVYGSLYPVHGEGGEATHLSHDLIATLTGSTECGLYKLLRRRRELHGDVALAQALRLASSYVLLLLAHIILVGGYVSTYGSLPFLAGHISLFGAWFFGILFIVLAPPLELLFFNGVWDVLTYSAFHLRIHTLIFRIGRKRGLEIVQSLMNAGDKDITQNAKSIWKLLRFYS